MWSFTLRYYLCLVVAILLSGIEMSTGQLLTAEYANVKLDSPNGCPRPFFDGQDKIYLFGGCGEEGNQIWVYSLSSDTIQKVGSLPGNSGYGSVQGDNLGNIFYLGGSGNFKEVYKFNLATNTTTLVAQLPTSLIFSTSFKLNDTSNTVYILGGHGQGSSVLSFDLQSFNYTVVTSIEYNVLAGAFVRVGDKVYLFAGALQTAFEFDFNALQMQTVGPPSLPQFTSWPYSVSDENFAYIIGGYRPTFGPAGGLIQFNTKTFENTFLPVGNFPVQDLNYFTYAPGSVFVPSLNRIYCFGGASFNSTLGRSVLHDDIFYIDLNPLVPTTTTTTEIPQTTTGQPIASTTTPSPDLFQCTNRTNGLYPHPTDCSMFIGCHNEELTYFPCPPPLLYDPKVTNCNFPDLVECGISCVDKPDGYYPHPYDCSLYIICRFSVPNVFKCSPPLLFHPDQRNCFFPDLVNCGYSS